MTSTSPASKPIERHLEVDVDQGLQLDRQYFLIPPRFLGKTVVSEHIGTLLRGREVRQAQGRHLLHVQQLGRGDTTMAGDNLTVFIDQHRIGEPELPDAVGNLSDLLLGVGARVALIGLEPAHRDHVDPAAGIKRSGEADCGRCVRMNCGGGDLAGCVRGRLYCCHIY